ncbi:single-stranded-DNA-specific exonuclease RecJ [Candidatus Nomurabacteria bacterium]|nr:MAG: single-stranded-DNA-specific exonuclease RecJ [Candidatus Nomurabacteria bacterium]
MKTTDLIDLLLEKRGITGVQDKEMFLHPSYERGMHDPMRMKNMERAVVRLYEAIEAKQKIVIYADYDCDGIPGAVMMHDLLTKIGYTNFSIYIPDRQDEGYGLHMDAIKQFIIEKVDLLITIDLGTTAVAEVAEAQANGIDVIITDHHLPHGDLPKAFALLNPKQEGDTYPYPMLAGSGVIFKYIQGFLFKYREYYKIPNGFEKWLLDMAGLATLADMVPLTGENRVIAYYGLMVLRKSMRPGLRALFSHLKIDQRHLAEDDITFMITPRLNAASRMDSPMRAFELLSETDKTKGNLLALHLSKINDERKVLVAQIMKDAYKHLEKRDLGQVIVIGNPSWRIGVLGLVAGKLCEVYKRPVFVWGRESHDGSTTLKGSCRSDGSISVVELMQAKESLFLHFGGHEASGGFSLEEAGIHFLEEHLTKSYLSLAKDTSESNVVYDAQLAVSDITSKMHTTLAELAPFGCENRKPTFLFSGVIVERVRQFGKEKNHLELHVSDGKRSIKAIAFFTTADTFDVSITEGSCIDLVATVELSYFGGQSELRLRIVTIQ